MSGAVLVAFSAAVGPLVQGWDNATIAGALFYIKKEFNLETQPTIVGLIVAMSLIGATMITVISGPVSDSLGRRPMLIMSSVFYFVSGLVMLWSPNVYVLLLARLLDGFGVGIGATIVSAYISETAPPEIRGQLNTFPIVNTCVGMFLSYCLVFTMSLKESPSWRLMVGALSIPSLAYFALAVFFLPESPRWLVSKGKMEEARKVLQRLFGKEDVSGEMALLCEGLSTGDETSIEEYIISTEKDLSKNQDHVKLYGAKENQSLFAKSIIRGQSTAFVSRYCSSIDHSTRRMDSIVSLFDSIHENVPDSKLGLRACMVLPSFGNMSILGEQHGRNEPIDEEAGCRDGDHDMAGFSRNESDDDLISPLLSREGTMADDHPPHGPSFFGAESNTVVEQVNGMDIGGGWHLAYRQDEKSEGGLKRMYLHQENASMSRHQSICSIPGSDLHAEGDAIHAAALVSKSVLKIDDVSVHYSIMEALIKPSESVPPKTSIWKELCEPGVKHALFVGVGLQLLQQFSGINGVLSYTPQILEQAGVSALLSGLHLGSESASFLISAMTTLLMIPSTLLAMRLMDIAGRRWLLLATIPIIISSLVILVLNSIIDLGSTIHSVISTISVVVYFCVFLMGFGAIPTILCSEIFPTRVRGICITICCLTFWFSNIAVTYTLPVLLNKIGIGGVFGMYAIVCTMSLVFVFLKVPETKGMPLEVITEFFAVGAK
ncbi:hypothetical protein LIER_09303 [Lithospermum erythrorhizon]|uniref:Major facilitator superfamily (MFS) profile domain-containing protein n=1 Tax=Lithospermum erythrorhizon TaxID=34254 RepID=A0AAV3PK00_LITER